ncbi:MAG TPA: UDP-N-acetylglucosamine 2-epimerase (non-hydrolyzing) [Methanomassiliicoccales archaeon]|nr:UDP-N-acetylglucosamine 2-epimerase (non-hydrolyzing) [Methanomassiliicoccales archaeon]
MRIATVVGARPQFIKCAPLSRELRKGHDEIIIHTGQHYDYEMSRVFFEELDIPEPDYNLEVGSASHASQTGRILIAAEEVLLKERPDLALVFGDTNSTLAGALAAAKIGIPVAHVEAGLRSYDRSMPEETNRVLTDHLSELLFAPTKVAVANLRKEGISKGVARSGDVMVDSLEEARQAAMKSSRVLERYDLTGKEFLAMTVHRASNTDSPESIRKIIRAIERSGLRTIFPIHPRTRKLMQDSGIVDELPENLTVTEPLGYLDMLALMINAKAILTDSGGMQKEAFILGVRCVTLRSNTEWPETLTEGRNRLVGLNAGRIAKALSLPRLRDAPRTHPFGKVGASGRIAKSIDIWWDRSS